MQSLMMVVTMEGLYHASRAVIDTLLKCLGRHVGPDLLRITIACRALTARRQREWWDGSLIKFAVMTMHWRRWRRWWDWNLSLTLCCHGLLVRALRTLL